MNYTVRLATEYDAAQILAIYEPYVLYTAISFELDPPDLADMRRRIVETLVHYPWLVCENSDGAVMGYAYASQHRIRVAYQWSVDVSIYIDKQYHKIGVGSALYRTMLAILSIQGYCTAYAGITLPNEGSIRLHEAAGFSLVGVFKDTGYKLGSWLDVGWWALQLRDYENSPKPPTAFSSIASSSEVLTLLEQKQRL